MHIFLCDHVQDVMLKSLASQIESIYDVDKGAPFPDFIGVGDSGGDLVDELIKKIPCKEKTFHTNPQGRSRWKRTNNTRFID